MQEERNVRWILAVSMVLIWVSLPSPLTFLGSSLYNLPIYRLPPHYTAVELTWYFINRVHILTFLLTITFTTLHHVNVGRRQLLYKLSIYMFIISMTSFFITFFQMLIGLPYR